MGDGTKENPYTREDVLKAIEKHGGTAERLDLSEKWFEEEIVLTELDLRGIILENAHLERAAHLVGTHFEKATLWGTHFEGAYLNGAHLEGADLMEAYLEGAKLRDAHLEGAGLWNAHLEGADLMDAHLEGAKLWDAQFSSETRLENTHWGDYVLGDEKGRWFDRAADAYRRLKQWYTTAGMYDIAGKFFFREMTAKRKAMKWWPNPLNRTFSKLISVLCGYGEKWERVIFSSAAIILMFTLIYFSLNSVWQWYAFWRSLYFSAASFTTSAWIDEKVLDVNGDLIRGLGVTESFIGVFMMALFLVTFTRKMTR